MDVVNQQLQPQGYSLSMRGIEDYIAIIKRESKNWIETMALDAYAFVAELKQQWDQMKELNRLGWEMLDKARQEGDINGEFKAMLSLFKANDRLLQLDLLLPQIGIPTPQRMQQQQQPQPLPMPKKRPIFDEHDMHLAEQERQQSDGPVFDESDMP
jgi:hypothetical protein